LALNEKRPEPLIDASAARGRGKKMGNRKNLAEEKGEGRGEDERENPFSNGKEKGDTPTMKNGGERVLGVPCGREEKGKPVVGDQPPKHPQRKKKKGLALS